LHTVARDNVYLAEHRLLKDYRTIAYTNVIEELVNQYKPNIFLLGATHIGRDLAPRVAHRVAAGLTADCTELTIDPDEGILLQTRPAFGGNLMATLVSRYSRPQMATVRPGVMEAIEPNPYSEGNVIRHKVSLSENEIGTVVLERGKEKKNAADISQAKIIIAGGKGIGDASGFDMLRKLAEVMGGEIAGSRAVVEEGWIPRERQVGQTGRTVRPDIYIACGISGTIQHRAGMMNSRYVIAINKDPGAPIFRIADWGIVGNVHEVVPEMIRQLEFADYDVFSGEWMPG